MDSDELLFNTRGLLANSTDMAACSACGLLEDNSQSRTFQQNGNSPRVLDTVIETRSLILTGLGLSGAMINLLVLLVVNLFSKIKLTIRPIISSLIVADLTLLMNVGVSGLRVVTAGQPPPCWLVTLLMLTSKLGTHFTVTTLSGFSFFAVGYPLKYRTWTSPVRAAVVLVCIWCAITLLSVLFSIHIKTSDVCLPLVQLPVSGLPILVSLLLVSDGLTIGLNVKLWLKLRARSKVGVMSVSLKSESSKSPKDTTLMTADDETADNSDQWRAQKSVRKEGNNDSTSSERNRTGLERDIHSAAIYFGSVAETSLHNPNADDCKAVAFENRISRQSHLFSNSESSLALSSYITAKHMSITRPDRGPQEESVSVSSSSFAGRNTVSIGFTSDVTDLNCFHVHPVAASSAHGETSVTSIGECQKSDTIRPNMAQSNRDAAANSRSQEAVTFSSSAIRTTASLPLPRRTILTMVFITLWSGLLNVPSVAVIIWMMVFERDWQAFMLSPPGMVTWTLGCLVNSLSNPIIYAWRFGYWNALKGRISQICHRRT